MTIEMGSTPPVHRVEDVLRPHRKALAALMRSSALSHGDVDAALAQVTEVAADVLRVERASVWRFDEARSGITCVELFERTPGRHTRGAKIPHAAATRYFDALSEERSIAAHDAITDSRTDAFAEGYLIPNGITSMLDAPIFLGGEMVGVVCHEHVGPARHWRLWEELVAATLADFVALVMSSAERIATEKKLDDHRKHLEQLVEERTAKLRESEEGLRKLFEASPVSLVLTRVKDQTVISTNKRAADMFEADGAASEGRKAADFWIDPADRTNLVQSVRATGRVEGFEARLRTLSGREFWAELAAQALVFEGEPALLVGVHDVTKQHLAEAALRQRGETLQKLLAAAPVPFILTGDDDGVVKYCNPVAAAMFEATVDEVVGQCATNFYLDPADAATFAARLHETGKIDGFEARLKTRLGRPFWALISARAFELAGSQVLMVGFSDVTRHKEIEEQLRELATTDALTGVYNRRHFFEVAENEITRSDRYGHSLAIALMDADNFKMINDTHGHAAGDTVLQLLAKSCRAQLRKTDVLARYGGEEFVVLMPETTLDTAKVVAERLRGAIEAVSFETKAGPRGFTVSIGVSARADREPLVALLKRADDAMYGAKRAGRNRVMIG